MFQHSAEQQPTVIGPCRDEKQDFGLEFPRQIVIDETLPWLSEQAVLWMLHVFTACVCALAAVASCITINQPALDMQACSFTCVAYILHIDPQQLL